jgi:hypothetical protein
MFLFLDGFGGAGGALVMSDDNEKENKGINDGERNLDGHSLNRNFTFVGVWHDALECRVKYNIDCGFHGCILYIDTVCILGLFEYWMEGVSQCRQHVTVYFDEDGELLGVPRCRDSSKKFSNSRRFETHLAAAVGRVESVNSI